jgi:hypothetical protein
MQRLINGAVVVEAMVVPTLDTQLLEEIFHGSPSGIQAPRGAKRHQGFAIFGVTGW